MPTENPEYNPNWQIIHDYHFGQLQQLKADSTRLMEGEGRAGHPLTEEFSRKWTEIHQKEGWHLQTMEDCFRMQFPTIQEHAAWVFRSFPPDQDARNPPAVDFEKFTSHDDIRKAWLKLRDTADARLYGLRERGQAATADARLLKPRFPR
jgi:hypothetical protein